VWDALIVDAAQSRSCRRLLSEDLPHGREFGSLRIEDPFR
jgi:predicted nucleic acid-binding protein